LKTIYRIRGRCAGEQIRDTIILSFELLWNDTRDFKEFAKYVIETWFHEYLHYQTQGNEEVTELGICEMVTRLGFTAKTRRMSDEETYAYLIKLLSTDENNVQAEDIDASTKIVSAVLASNVRYKKAIELSGLDKTTFDEGWNNLVSSGYIKGRTLCISDLNTVELYMMCLVAEGLIEREKQ